MSGMLSLCRRFLLPVLAAGVLWPGCGASSVTQHAGHDSTSATMHALQSLRGDILRIGERLSSIEESVPLLLYGPDLCGLFGEMRRACGTPEETQGTPGLPPRANVYTRCELRGAITAKEQDLDLRASSIGQKLLSTLRHEVVYLNLITERPTSARTERLQIFAKERPLRTTRYLLVTAPSPAEKEAARRAKAVEELLISSGIDATRFDKPWIYPLKITIAQLKPIDQPTSGEPKDTERAVFVFRLDC